MVCSSTYISERREVLLADTGKRECQPGERIGESQMGNRRNFLRNATSQSARIAALAGFILLASNGSMASANDRMSFREFRQQNDGLAKSAARQLFREQFGRHNTASSSGQFGITYQPNLPTVNFGAGGEPIFASKNIAGLKRVHEPRVRNQSMQELSSGNITRVNRGVELDLGSNLRNIVLGRSLFDSNETVSISVGGKTENFSAGSKVTAAEYVAVKQVLSGGGQQVEVDRNGRASGGSVDLGALTSENDVMRASSLVVPKDVTTIGDFGRGSDFRLTGDLSNFGTVQTLSTNTSVRGGTIHADNIDNHSGALISARGDLSLDAANNLTNYGVIAASGNLSLSAGGAVSNSGTVAAGEDLSVTSTKVINRGSLNANSGNVSFATTGGDLIIDNRGGSIVATDGSINVRASDYAGSANSLLVGGDLLSRELNLNSGLGTATVEVNKLTGIINESGSAAHVSAFTEALNIGSICLTGDPTFYNRGAYVNIVGDITVAEDLTIVAATNIYAADGVTISAGDSSKGYNITLVAGAGFVSTSGSDVFGLGPVSLPPYPEAGAISIYGAAKNGGGIYFGDNVLISSRSTDVSSPGDRPGGNVEIFAFGKNEGQILLGGTRIETGGVNLGANGDVLVVGEHTFKNYQYPTLWIKSIDTTNQSGGPQGAGGDITVSGSKPTIVGGTSVNYNADGSRAGTGRLAAGTSVVPYSWVILGYDDGDNPLPAISAAGDLVVKSDYTIMQAEVNATNISLGTSIGLRADVGTLTGTNSVTLTTGKKGLIGYDAPVSVSTPNLTVTAAGGSAGVFIATPSTTNVSITGKSIGLYAPLSLLTGTVDADDNLDLLAADLNLAPISVKNNLSVATTVAPLTDDGTRYNATNLFIGGASVGTSAADTFVVSSSVKKLAISAGDAFVSTAGTKKAVDLIGANVDNLVLKGAAGITISGNVTATETISLESGAKSITVGELAVLQAADSISIVHSGTTKKDKIVLAKGSALQTTSTTAGQGNILIQLGVAGGAAIPAPPNVTVNGNVQILGLGLSGKSPANTLSGINAGVTVSNSIAVKNILLGGNVQVSATGP